MSLSYSQVWRQQDVSRSRLGRACPRYRLLPLCQDPGTPDSALQRDRVRQLARGAKALEADLFNYRKRTRATTGWQAAVSSAWILPVAANCQTIKGGWFLVVSVAVCSALRLLSGRLTEYTGRHP